MPTQPKLKVSLITTERNEASDIGAFIDSALAQSMPPDEIRDCRRRVHRRTLDVIKQRIEAGAPIKLVNAPGNRSVGRNAATKAARNEIIACTDVGSRLDRDWLTTSLSPLR